MFKLQNILRSAVAMTLLLLAGAAGAQSESAEKALAQLVKDVVIALALRLETAGRQRWNAGDTARA